MSSSSRPGLALSETDKTTLLHLAAEGIEYGLDFQDVLPVQVGHFSPPLQATRATFVTLHNGGKLRGCIGTLEARRALVVDVVHNTHAAAFGDPRFPPLSRGEYPRLDVEISVLSPAEPLQFDSEADLLRQLRPHVDGLILQDGYRRGTFLPAVWESLGEPREFFRHLKLKAGLPPNYWSDGLEVSRYTTESFGQTVEGLRAGV